jgi:hypothetical protein
MPLTMHAMTVDGFAPMLESLSALLDKAKPGMIDARLAPDMYTLAQQVMLACHHAQDAFARLTGQPPHQPGEPATSLPAMKAQIAEAAAALQAADASAFDGAETRDCSIDIPGNQVIAMNGEQFLRAWAIPHFYFHLVTAYDILRHQGVALGKPDYLSAIGRFIRPKA